MLEVGMAYNGYCMGGPLNGKWMSCDTPEMFLAKPKRRPLMMIDNREDEVATRKCKRVWYEHIEAGQNWIYMGDA